MAEYIEREAVCSDCKNQKVCVDKSVCPVGRAPAADVEVVKHGRWIEHHNYIQGFYGNTDYKCSVCGLERDWVGGANYCPNCGAKMALEVTNG